MRLYNLLILFILIFVSTAHSKIDLVILPKKESVQLTIYNSQNLTLVQEKKNLTLKQGTNKIQFSWEDTLIDPTSIDIQVKKKY